MKFFIHFNSFRKRLTDERPCDFGRNEFYVLLFEFI